MKKQTFQHAELRDENDNIIQPGSYGKNTVFTSSTNDGILDYVMNDLEYLYEKQGTGGGGTGKDGKSAYEIAVENGYTGTVKEWLGSLKGERGDDGSPGVKGEKGERGPQGPPGKDGSDATVDLSGYVKKSELFENNMIVLPNGAKIGVE